MDVRFCEGRNHRREARVRAAGSARVRRARSSEARLRRIFFSLTKTYMEVGNSYLIWSDPVHSCESVGWFLLLFEDRASSSRGRCERRLISLIFAGRNRIILIRRELPLTYVASPAKPVAKVRRGFSFVPAPAAAGPVLEWSSVIHSLDRLCFFLLGKVFAFSFVGSFFVMPPSAACRPFPL